MSTDAEQAPPETVLSAKRAFPSDEFAPCFNFSKIFNTDFLERGGGFIAPILNARV